MIKLTKININPNSEVPHAATVEEYRIDQERGTWGQFFEGKSPPVDYWVIGELVGPIEIGKPVLIDRHNRNGVEIRGTMYTSVVLKIDNHRDAVYITTANSVYKLENL